MPPTLSRSHIFPSCNAISIYTHLSKLSRLVSFGTDFEKRSKYELNIDVLYSEFVLSYYLLIILRKIVC